MLELASKVAATSSVDPVFALLVGALGAAALTVAAGFIGAWFQSRREHVRWVREQRLIAYKDLMRAAEGLLMFDDTETPSKDDTDFVVELMGRVGIVRLLGPESVGDALTEYLRTVLDLVGNRTDKPAHRKYEAARTTFITAARKELQIAEI